MIRLTIALLFCLLLPNACVSAGTVTSFDDIKFWVGAGNQQAALAIDWFGDASDDTALVWGYRWNGTATGEQMLRDVLAEDSRLYAKLSGGGGNGIAVYGLGYDQNNDNEFALDDDTLFNADGIAITPKSDGVESVDMVDRYREGWSSGFWHYGLSSSDVDGTLSGWGSSGSGSTGRVLSNGDWDSHAFATTGQFNEFATHLIAAEPPGLLGDFNSDGQVDAADYTVWRDGLGTEYTQSQYNDWVSNYGAGIGNSANNIATTTTVPEPTTAAGILLLLLTIVAIRSPFPLGENQGESAPGTRSPLPPNF